MAVLGRTGEQRRFDREQNNRVRRANLSLSGNPEQLFKEWKAAGYVSKEIKSWQHLEEQYNSLIKSGIKSADARKKLMPGKPGASIFSKDYDTGEYKINRRAIRTTTAPATRQIADQIGGAGTGDKFDKDIRQSFDTPGVKGGEMRAKARMAHLNAGKPETGKIEYDLGHYRAAAHADGAGYDGSKNMDPEPSYINQAHIAKDRLKEADMRELGIPLNGPEAAVEELGELSNRSGLQTRGGHLPQPILDDLSTSVYKGSVETARTKGELDYTPQGPNSGVKNPARSEAVYKNWDTGLEIGPSEYGRVKSVGQGLAIADRAEQLGLQGKDMRPVLDQISPTTSKGDAVSQSGPVRTVKPKNPQVVDTATGYTRRATGVLGKAAKFAPLAGLGIALGNAAQAAQQGDFMGAAGHVIEGVVGEVPVVGDVAVDAAQGSPVADGTIEGAERTQLQIQQRRDKNPSQHGLQGPDVPRPTPTYKSNRQKLIEQRRRRRKK